MQRARAKYLGGSDVRYTWPCGHTRKETLMVGPKGRGSKRLRKPMGSDMVRKLVHYWEAANGVIAGPCPQCKRKKGGSMKYKPRDRNLAVKTVRPSGVKHEFMERADSNVCHLCLMPKNHIDHEVNHENDTRNHRR